MRLHDLRKVPTHKGVDVRTRRPANQWRAYFVARADISARISSHDPQDTRENSCHRRSLRLHAGNHRVHRRILREQTARQAHSTPQDARRRGNDAFRRRDSINSVRIHSDAAEPQTKVTYLSESTVCFIKIYWVVL